MSPQIEMFEMPADVLEKLNSPGARRLLDLSDTEEGGQGNDLEENKESNKPDLFNGDPSIPLDDAMTEKMLQDIVAGIERIVAYQRAGHPNCTRQTATQQVSRVLRRSANRARLRWLYQQRAATSAASAKSDERMTRDERRQILTQAARSAATVADKVAAIKTLELLDEEDEAAQRRPDPAYLMHYFKTAEKQGLDVRQEANEVTA